MNITVATGIAAVLALATPISPGADPTAHDSLAPVAEAAAVAATAEGAVVNVGTFRLSGFLGFAHVPAKACPRSAQYLDGNEYHPGSGWLIPGGVSIDTRGLFVGANLRPNEGGRGIIGGVITSLSGAGDVTVRLHCTDAQP